MSRGRQTCGQPETVEMNTSKDTTIKDVWLQGVRRNRVCPVITLLASVNRNKTVPTRQDRQGRWGKEK